MKYLLFGVGLAVALVCGCGQRSAKHENEVIASQSAWTRYVNELSQEDQREGAQAVAHSSNQDHATGMEARAAMLEAKQMQEFSRDPKYRSLSTEDWRRMVYEHDEKVEAAKNRMRQSDYKEPYNPPEN